MPTEELLHAFYALGAGEQASAVAGAFDLDKGDIGASFLQGLGQRFTLGDRDGLVLVAVHDEKRSRVLGDVSHGTGLGCFLPVLQWIAADQLGACFLRSYGEKIRGTVPIHNSLDPAGLVLVTARPFQFLDPRGRSQQRDQMTTGRSAQASLVGRIGGPFPRSGGPVCLDCLGRWSSI